MGSAGMTPWDRFHAEVASSESWPRELWSLAVRDALADALPEESPLLAEFEEASRELETIEGRGRTTYHDDWRARELETRLRELVSEANREIRARAPDPASEPRSQANPAVAPSIVSRVPARGWRTRSLAVGGSIAAAGVGLGVGAVAALYVYDLQLDDRVDRALEPRLAEARHAMAQAEAKLEKRIADAGAEHATAAAIRKDLEAVAEQVRRVTDGSLEDIAELRDASIRDLERRLDARSGEVQQSIERLQLRSAALVRGLDDVSADLADIEDRLPGVQNELEALARRIAVGHDDADAVANGITALKAVGLELVGGVEEARASLDAKMTAQRQTLQTLDERITTLEGAVDQAMERASRLDRAMEERVADADARAAELEGMIEAFEATRSEMVRLLDQTRQETARLRTDVAARLDEILNKTAERADLTVLRSEDVLRRAETQALGNLEASTDEALDVIARARAKRVADLSREVQATRIELEQTRAGLISSWQRMDALVAERQDELLSELDDYQASLERELEDVKASAPEEALQRASSEDDGP